MSDDLIDRQYAIATAITGRTREIDGERWIRTSEVRESLKRCPSAQPEIIRCKDCKYCDRGIDEDGIPFLKCLGWSYGGTHEDDFCSHAERRTDG